VASTSARGPRPPKKRSVVSGRAVQAGCRRTIFLHVIEELKRGDMLPSIYFIFSRRGCREALQRCSYHEIDLTTAAEKEAIDRVAAERLRASRT